MENSQDQWAQIPTEVLDISNPLLSMKGDIDEGTINMIKEWAIEIRKCFSNFGWWLCPL